MVQPSSSRLANYTAGLDPAAIGAKFTAKKDLMIAAISPVFDALTAMETQALAVMNAANIVQNDKPKYYNFCREIWHKVAVGVVDPALTAQVIAELQPKYQGLGCATAELRQLAALFNVVIP